MFESVSLSLPLRRFVGDGKQEAPFRAPLPAVKCSHGKSFLFLLLSANAVTKEEESDCRCFSLSKFPIHSAVRAEALFLMRTLLAKRSRIIVRRHHAWFISQFFVFCRFERLRRRCRLEDGRRREKGERAKDGKNPHESTSGTKKRKEEEEEEKPRIVGRKPSRRRRRETRSTRFLSRTFLLLLLLLFR